MSSESRGQLFVVSAPSGTGKTTLVERLVQVVPDLLLSRSFTSRAPRAGEHDGVDYNFISRERFETMKAAGEFLECADVFGNYYGTSAIATDTALARGRDLVLVIDVQGARQVRSRTSSAVGIFVLPPSFAVLEDRLRRRSKDSDEQIRRRLAVARSEVDAVADYDYVVVNDEVEPAVQRLKAIVEAERSRLGRMKPAALRIIESFR
jgi:guanylate kinase